MANYKIVHYLCQTANLLQSNVEFYFSSPEDIIIAKLQWYRIGGFVSERQWLDVIGVINVQGDLLDKKYLKK